MGRGNYNAATKGTALTALLAGNTPRHVAEEYGIPVNTVKSWRRRLKRGEIATLHPKKRNGDVLQEYLSASLLSLIAQARYMADTSWLRRQSAGDLALLEGTLFDRTLRSLEMLGSLQRSLRDLPGDRGEA